MIIKNANVLDGTGGFRQTDILVSDAKIVSLGECAGFDEEIDAGGGYVFPGLIDVHTHAIGRQTILEGSLREYARMEACCGATTLIPTLFGPPEEVACQMRLHRRETNELSTVPNIGGFRLESPYLAFAGGGMTTDLAPISRDLTEMLLDAGGGHIRIWDFSPELPGALEEIEYLSSRGILCSIAHTGAPIEKVRQAIDMGARHVTHLFDTFALPEMTDSGVYPAGLVDYLLVEDRVSCEIIADGTHVPPILVEKAIRCKSAEGILFVTDSNYGAGLDAGEYDLPGERGRIRIDGPNNGVRFVEGEEGEGLTGSALTPLDAFRNAIRLFGKDAETASKLCSTNPARLLKLNKGEIAVGKDADFIILDQYLELQFTLAGGKVLYQKS